ncbi:MAG TPA: NADH-quinone oxidoreductase subunit M, partial [Gemmata sp.]|nr:NADH-quinone oxidoreductase subunit M [Gemmata sp.]
MLATTRVLLLLVVFLPLVSAALVPLFGSVARRVALWLALFHLTALIAMVSFAVPVLNMRAESVGMHRETGLVKFQPVFVPGDDSEKAGTSYRTTWTLLSLTPAPTNKPGPHIQFFVGLDGLNIWLVALASFMLIVAILISWESIQERPGAFYGWMFLLQGGAIGAFLSFDVILFYAFFELTLIPSFFLIGGWGTGSGRRDAARKFFLYTLAGSFLTLIGVIGIVLTNPNSDGTITFSLPDLMGNVQNKLYFAYQEAKAGNPEKLHDLQRTQSWFFGALMAGFMVKVPIWPFHTWLPSAYGESPIGVTVLLASLLAKLGTFGILRFVLTLTPDAALAYGLPAIGWLAAFGIVYAALCAYDQKDIKLTIAYSSVSHLGFLVLGIFAFNREGLSGAILHMVNHGLSTGALFALLAFLLDRYKTTQVVQYGGLMGRFPNFAVLAFILILASIGLPGLNNFVSEMLMLAGLFDTRNPDIRCLGLAVIAAIGILLSAWYMLTMMQKVFFNPSKEPEPVTPEPTDVKRREFLAFGSLAALCLLLGLAPQLVLDTLQWDVKQLSTIGDSARERAGIPLPPEDTPPPIILRNEPPLGLDKLGGGGGPKGGGGGKA